MAGMTTQHHDRTLLELVRLAAERNACINFVYKVSYARQMNHNHRQNALLKNELTNRNRKHLLKVKIIVLKLR